MGRCSKTRSWLPAMNTVLRAGTVSSQSNSDANLFQNIQVKPLVDLTSIESVVVLVPKSR